MYGTSANLQEIPRTIPTDVRKAVEMTLTDGTVLTGDMFMLAHQFILDVINDDRRFVPFAAADGTVSVINNEVIARITEVERQVSTNHQDRRRKLMRLPVSATYPSSRRSE